ncbi:MAG: hypothetical protein K2X66_19015 [Cyanobacteria bacterium]|nr:hypothetical protein [Cyanobacteriota bacterium]
MSKFKPGQSLSEYALPIALVSLIGIVSLSLLGNTLSDMFTNLVTQKNNTGIVAIKPPSKFQNSGGNNTLTATSNIPFANLPGKIVQMNLSNGKSMTLNFANPVAVADSVGGNGVTENAVALLQQIAQQLRDQGEDPNKIAELEKLAQYGQKIKDLQKQVEAKFPKEGFKSTVDRFNFLINPANSIMVEGKETTLLDASSLLSSYNGTPDYFPKNSFQNYDVKFVSSNSNQKYDGIYANYFRSNRETTEKTPLVNFMNQLQKVENSGLLSNPQLKQLVKDDLSFQIFNSANQTVRMPTKSDVSELVKITRVGSNDICTLAKSTLCQDRG